MGSHAGCVSSESSVLDVSSNKRDHHWLLGSVIDQFSAFAHFELMIEPSFDARDCSCSYGFIKEYDDAK